MVNISLFEHLKGKAVTCVRAFGVDEFDFTHNIVGCDFSVGEFGYAVFEFEEHCLFISVDGLTIEKPRKENVHELPVHSTIIETFVGAVLESIDYDNEKYNIKFVGYDTLSGYFEPNDGMTDRAYFELEFPWY